MLTISRLWERVESAPRAEFLVTPQDRVTYGELAGLVRSWLAVFDAEELVVGSRVMIVTGNEVAAVTSFIAAFLDGLVPVMLTPDTPEARVSVIAASVEPGLILGDAGRKRETWGAIGSFRAIRPTAVSSRENSPGWRLIGKSPVSLPAKFGLDLPEGDREPRLPEEDDQLGYILFTSGTTQDQSGVMLTRRNLLANLETISRVFRYDSQSRIFNDMVLAHADGLVQGPMLALANGCALIRSGGFTVQGLEDWLNRVRRERASHVITVPAVWSMIDRYARHDDYFDSPECQGLLSVAARLDGSLWKRLETRFGRPVFNQYGLTETVTSALYAGPHPEMGAFDSIGCPVDCEARIAQLGSQSEEAGELELRGENIFPGYWKNPTRNAASFTEDGWLRTGDIVRLRSDRSYEILGRIKTVIVCGGFLIRPEEIDEVIKRHPDVAESATVGMPDPDFGEIPVTAVVLDSFVDEAALTAHARTQLEAFKVPKRIIALPAIPRGEAGKPRLNDLRGALRDALSSEAGTGRSTEAANTTQRVCAVAAEVLRVDPASLSPNSSPETVRGWDSFAQVNLIIAAETHFGLRIPVNLAVGMRSLADLITLVERARR